MEYSPEMLSCLSVKLFPLNFPFGVTAQPHSILHVDTLCHVLMKLKHEVKYYL